jgi:phage terminase large subunit
MEIQKTITPTIKPLPKQHLAWQKLLDKVTKYILFGGGAGGGKSWLGCEWLLVMCYQYPKSKWFIGRKELKRLMASSYETFKKVCSYHKIPEKDWKLNGQYNYIEFFNGSKIDLLDVNFVPTDPLFERFGSLEYTGGWLEEAGEIDFKAFDVLKTRVGRHLNKEYGLHPKLLITANPKKGWLKRLFYNPFKNGILGKSYAFIRSLYSDNNYTSDIYGEQLNEISDKATRDRLRDGNWDYDDDKACLVKGEAIDDLFTNTVEDGEKYATLDIARFGKDSTKLYLWKGFKNYKRYTWFFQDTEITAQKVKEVLEEERIPYSHVIADEVGVGGGVIDKLRGINGFIANSSPLEQPNAKPIMVMRNGKLVSITPKENFKTLKDQCGYILSDKINERGMALSVEDESEKELISEEISELKDFAPDEDGKKRLVPKDIIKENIGRSPDDLDNLIMRMWFTLNREPSQSSSIYIPNNEL